jgi:hypothetical protein
VESHDEAVPLAFHYVREEFGLEFTCVHRHECPYDTSITVRYYEMLEASILPRYIRKLVYQEFTPPLFRYISASLDYQPALHVYLCTQRKAVNSRWKKVRLVRREGVIWLGAACIGVTISGLLPPIGHIVAIQADLDFAKRVQGCQTYAQTSREGLLRLKLFTSMTTWPSPKRRDLL